jgi:hypothetical protein
LKYSPWFAAGVTAWVGLGFAAFCFLLCRFLPTRPPNGFLETLGQSVVGMLWGLSLPGSMFVQQCLPKMPEKLVSWHWAVFALVPVLVVLSFVVASDVLQRRTFAVVGGKGEIVSANESHRASHGLVGVPLFLAVIVGRAVLIVGALALFQFVFFFWISSTAEFARWWRDGNPAFGTQVVSITLIFASICGETVGLRALRTLPLSTQKSVALLLAAPVALGFVGAIFSSRLGGRGALESEWLVSYTAQAIALAGFGSLALATVLHVASGWRIAVLIGVALLPSMGFSFIAESPLALVFIGAATLLGGAALLHRGLRKSSAFYQPRRMFGMTVGQPVAVR